MCIGLRLGAREETVPIGGLLCVNAKEVRSTSNFRKGRGSTMVKWRQTVLSAALSLTMGLASFVAGQAQQASKNAAPQPISGNIVRLQIETLMGEKPESFRVAELEGGVIRVKYKEKLWGISPKIKDSDTVLLEVYEVKRLYTDGDTVRELFNRIEALEVTRATSAQIRRAPFKVQLEQVIFTAAKTPPELDR